MEAPKKVYLHLTTGSRLLNGKYYEYKPAKIRFDDKIIEYIRTDAFIKKACKFISLNVTDYIDVTHKGGIEHLALQEKFIEGFKKYMENRL